MKRDAQDARRIRQDGVTARQYLSLRAAQQAKESLQARGWSRVAIHGNSKQGLVLLTAARDKREESAR